MDGLGAWLTSGRPAGEPPTIIHGGCHLDYVMFGPLLPPRVIAILDWETATIGDPLVDLGLASALWPDPDEERLPLGEGLDVGALGFGSRRDLAQRYAERTGRSIAPLPYYQALGLFRLACIREGSLARHA